MRAKKIEGVEGVEKIEDGMGVYYMKDGKLLRRVERAMLPKTEKGQTLQDQDDIEIWTKFNILLQAVDECTAEYGSAADHSGVANVTRQLRVVTQEVVRRGMFEISVKHREPTDETLWTWYEVLKQLLEGERKGKWKTKGDSNREYTVVVKALLERGHEMPKQSVGLKALDLLGELIK